MSEPSVSTPARPQYRIGAVANITGLSTHSIRAWERRYELKIASRSEGGTRLYTDEDVVLLSLLKALTDQGDAISEIAGLSADELRERLKLHNESVNGHKESGSSHTSPAFTGKASEFAKTVVVGEALNTFVQQNVALGARLNVVCELSDAQNVNRDIDGQQPDLLLGFLKNLGPDPVAAVKEWQTQTNDALVILFYDFAQSSILSRLGARGVKLIRWPVDVAMLVQLIPDYLMIHALKRSGESAEKETDFDSPARIFSDEQLLKARETSSAIKCECPHHLASILFDLNAFEEYSRQCANETPDDEALHLELAQKTATARSLLEQMLAKVCAHDNLKI